MSRSKNLKGLFALILTVGALIVSASARSAAWVYRDWQPRYYGPNYQGQGGWVRNVIWGAPRGPWQGGWGQRGPWQGNGWKRWTYNGWGMPPRYHHGACGGGHGRYRFHSYQRWDDDD